MLKGRLIASVVAGATVTAVLCGGAAAATTVGVRTHPVSGTVGSVNGSSAAGTCGTARSTGDFTLASGTTTYTVDVGATSTTFKEHGVSAPSFADVCVGDKVRARGTVSANDVVTASLVTVVPGRTHPVSGTVGSVNGSSAAGTCGTARSTGDFTLASGTTTYTVDVGATSTTFKEHGVSAPSFADVCVGDKVRARGTVSANDVVTASLVTVVPGRTHPVSGTVGSVNGSSAAGTCGTARSTGDFTLASGTTTYTVDVGATSTTFKEHGVSAPSFADVCVGDKVRARGTVSANDVVTASLVTVVPGRTHPVSGTVGSVNGSSAAGTCGTARSTGDFTLASGTTTYTVDVGATSTTFKEHGVSAPSFADVCVGDKVRARGTVSANDVVTASLVTVVVNRPRRVSGSVAAVNGSSTCGAAGFGGAFTVVSQGTTYTVDVGATKTLFKEHGVSAPSFADVCAGDTVHVLGSVSQTNVVTATEVTVVPPPK